MTVISVASAWNPVLIPRFDGNWSSFTTGNAGSAASSETGSDTASGTGKTGLFGSGSAVEAGSDSASGISNGLVNITGTGFGTRSASPFMFENFDAYADNYKAVLNVYNTSSNNGQSAGITPFAKTSDSAEYPYYPDGATPYVSSARSKIGTKSLRWDLQNIAGGGTVESRPCIGVKDFNSRTLYQCWYQYITRTAGSGTLGLFKVMRAGKYTAGDPGTWYGGRPLGYCTHEGFTTTQSTTMDLNVFDEAGTSHGSVSVPTSPLRLDAWDFCEWEFVLDGSVGRYVERINGVTNANFTNIPTSTVSTNVIDGSFTSLICDFPSGSAFSIFQDLLCMDKSLGRVITTDNATYSAAMKFLPQHDNITSWSNTLITLTSNPTREAAMFGSGATVRDHVWAVSGAYIGSFPRGLP